MQRVGQKYSAITTFRKLFAADSLNPLKRFLIAAEHGAIINLGLIPASKQMIDYRSTTVIEKTCLEKCKARAPIRSVRATVSTDKF